MRPNSALLTDAVSLVRCVCGAAKRERWASYFTRRGFSSTPMKKQTSSRNKSRATANAGAPLLLEDQEAWLSWLRKNHATSSGVWLRIAKKSANVSSVSYPQAVDAALCFGWIDGQKKGDDES